MLHLMQLLHLKCETESEWKMYVIDKVTLLLQKKCANIMPLSIYAVATLWVGQKLFTSFKIIRRCLLIQFRIQFAIMEQHAAMN